MGFLFGVMGAVLGVMLGAAVGGMLGDIAGAILGVPVGLVGGVVLGLRAHRNWNKPKPAARGDAHVAAPSGPLAAVVLRVQALENEIGALRAEVSLLRARTATAPMPESPTPVAEAAEPSAAASGDTTPPTPLPGPADAFPPSAATAPASEPVDEPEAPARPRPEPATAPEPVAARLAAPAPPPVPLRDRLPPFLSRWIFGGNTIVKVGVLILFLGLAFLLRYAAERVTVPVELRYAGVGLIGVVLLVLGWRLRARTDAAGGTGYGLILQGAGIGVFYLTVLAAIKLHALLPAEAAFAVMAAVAVFGAMLAVMQDAPWLALVAMAEGFAAPVLVSTGSGHHIAFFSYLAILDIGIFLMAWHKAWRPLNLIGATATFALAGAWAQGHYEDSIYASTQAFLLLFFLLFTAIGVLFARRALALAGEPEAGRALSQRALDALRQVGRVDSTLTFGVPLAAFGLQYLLVRDHEYGPAWSAFGFALFYLLLGGSLLRRGGARYALLGEAYVIVSVIFATVTIPLALEGAWTGATWAVEAAGMYWLGMRQHRPYARAFAFVVLAAAVARLASSLGVDLQPGTPLITGSLIGVLLLLGSLLAMLRVQALGDATQRPAWEDAAAPLLPALATASVLTLVWMVLAPLWASMASAWLGLACIALPLGISLTLRRVCGAAAYAVALAGLASTLHSVHDQAQLAGGWTALLATLLIGLSLLAAAALGWRAQARALADRDSPPRWPLAQDLALLIGLAVMNLALLYAMPLEQAVRIWPWIGLGLLALALRTAHPALAIAWFALQLGPALAGMAASPPLWSAESGSTGWLALSLTLTGLLAGDWVQRHLRSAPRWPSTWTRSPELQWSLVVWSLAWWSQWLPPEIQRRLLAAERLDYWPAALVGWVIVSGLLMSLAMRWRGWVAMGQATAATVPAWIAIALILGPAATGLAPSAHGGWLAWPLALLWHGELLRQQRGLGSLRAAHTGIRLSDGGAGSWFSFRLQQILHGLGFWLFVLLAAREAQLALAGLGEPGSAWPVLGFVLVPALVIGVVTRPALQRRWPLNEQREAYLLAGCGPLALYLLLWLWVGNLTPGDAAPLPYLPLLNPLELAQWLVLLALLHFGRALPATLWQKLPSSLPISLFGATAFALFTGLVLRACHHFARVAWSGEALFASTLTQAALSIAWATVAVGLMLLGHRRARRLVWVLGAALLAVVVAKLFLVELADHGGLYRIVSFIIVGALLLVVGYFAPVPPRQTAAAAKEGAP